MAKSPPVEKQQPKGLKFSPARGSLHLWAHKGPGPAAGPGGAFLLRMESLTGYIIALLVGVAHSDWALGFHPLRGGAGDGNGKERIWGSLMLLRKTTQVSYHSGHFVWLGVVCLHKCNSLFS